MMIFRPTIFDQFPEVSAALSLRDESRPAAYSLLYGGPDEVIAANRTDFCQQLGFEAERLAIPREVHGDVVSELPENYRFDTRAQGDGLITDRPDWLIGVTIADCAAIVLYDSKHRAVGAIHSGWRGTVQNIVGAGITALHNRYQTDPVDLWVYICPTPQRFEFEVGLEVAEQFNEKYISPKNESKFWLDNKLAVYDQLLATGVPASQIEADPRSNYAPGFHSARRDGDGAGRMVCAIGLKPR